MYYCSECRKEFEYVKIYFQETPGGYERFHLCPFCSGTDFYEKKGVFCKFCGGRINIPGKEYCCETCRRAGEKLFRRQEENKKKRLASPLYQAVCEVDEYNKTHNCNLSYGQYYALKGADMI